MKSHITLTVAVNQEGLRLDQLLSAEAADLSRVRVQKLIREGQASILRQQHEQEQNLAITDPAWRVKATDIIHLNIPPSEDIGLTAQAIALDVLHEDEDVIVINKPAGLVVHPAPGNADGTLVNALMAHCGDSLSGIGGQKRPGIVHRLDKDTSGVMIAAKNHRAHRALAAQFAAHGKDGRMQRAYEALVWGTPLPAKGRIEAALARHPQNRKKMAVSKHASARFAATRYTTVQNWGTALPVTHVRCELETGRTHQIRVHMAHHGYPVVGDQVYGSSQMSRIAKLPAPVAPLVKALGRQALHAVELGFEHPTSGESMLFRADLPDDLHDILQMLDKCSKAA